MSSMSASVAASVFARAVAERRMSFTKQANLPPELRNALIAGLLSAAAGGLSDYYLTDDGDKTSTAPDAEKLQRSRLLRALLTAARWGAFGTMGGGLGTLAWNYLGAAGAAAAPDAGTNPPDNTSSADSSGTPGTSASPPPVPAIGANTASSSPGVWEQHGRPLTIGGAAGALGYGAHRTFLQHHPERFVFTDVPLRAAAKWQAASGQKPPARDTLKQLMHASKLRTDTPWWNPYKRYVEHIRQRPITRTYAIKLRNLLGLPLPNWKSTLGRGAGASAASAGALWVLDQFFNR